jgi:hypothetical protein
LAFGVEDVSFVAAVELDDREVWLLDIIANDCTIDQRIRVRVVVESDPNAFVKILPLLGEFILRDVWVITHLVALALVGEFANT